uniref:Uncharacterized protein n=1 Tax=Anguilla anguilla TaxID=7936 RepID=A0A0E9PJB9_ANGAN
MHYHRSVMALLHQSPVQYLFCHFSHLSMPIDILRCFDVFRKHANRTL